MNYFVGSLCFIVSRVWKSALLEHFKVIILSTCAHQSRIGLAWHLVPSTLRVSNSGEIGWKRLRVASADKSGVVWLIHASWSHEMLIHVDVKWFTCVEWRQKFRTPYSVVVHLVSNFQTAIKTCQGFPHNKKKTREQELSWMKLAKHILLISHEYLSVMESGKLILVWVQKLLACNVVQWPP